MILPIVKYGDPVLQKEGEAPARGTNAVTAWSKVYSTGVADALRNNQDQLLTQTVLGQALAPDEALAQVRALLDWVNRLGHMDLTTFYGPREFHYDLRLTLGK